jgi:hypothetical protein
LQKSSSDEHEEFQIEKIQEMWEQSVFPVHQKKWLMQEQVCIGVYSLWGRPRGK